MAKPIREVKRTDPTAQELESEALSELLKVIAEHRESIKDLLAIVGYLEEMGVLAALKGLLEQRNEVGVIALNQLNQPKMYHLLKNLVTMVQLMGSMDPVHLEKMGKGLSQGLETMNEKSEQGRVPSLWDLAKSVRDPSVRTSMATMIGLLQGMGDSMKQDSSSVH